MHHNQIINSSIIINIIVRGSPGKRDSFDDPMELLLPSIIQEAFDEDQDQQEILGELQEPDLGRMKVEDRYHRLYFGQLQKDDANTVVTDLPTEGTTEANDDWF